MLNQYKEVEKIIFIPVNEKYPKKGLLSNEHRRNMLRLVAKNNSKFLISDMDMNGEKSLPTIETLEKTQQQFPDKQICFLTRNQLKNEKSIKYLVPDEVIEYIEIHKLYKGN